jgi:hypothetical protein
MPPENQEAFLLLFIQKLAQEEQVVLAAAEVEEEAYHIYFRKNFYCRSILSLKPFLLLHSFSNTPYYFHCYNAQKYRSLYH